MSVYGKIDNFDIENNNWRDYEERIEQYFYANDIDDEKKQTAIFLTLIGSETYGLLKSLIAPVTPAKKSLVAVSY